MCERHRRAGPSCNEPCRVILTKVCCACLCEGGFADEEGNGRSGEELRRLEEVVWRDEKGSTGQHEGSAETLCDHTHGAGAVLHYMLLRFFCVCCVSCVALLTCQFFGYIDDFTTQVAAVRTEMEAERLKAEQAKKKAAMAVSGFAALFFPTAECSATAQGLLDAASLTCFVVHRRPWQR